MLAVTYCLVITVPTTNSKVPLHSEPSKDQLLTRILCNRRWQPANTVDEASVMAYWSPASPGIQYANWKAINRTKISWKHLNDKQLTTNDKWLKKYWYHTSNLLDLKQYMYYNVITRRSNKIIISIIQNKMICINYKDKIWFNR